MSSYTPATPYIGNEQQQKQQQQQQSVYFHSLHNTLQINYHIYSNKRPGCLSYF